MAMNLVKLPTGKPNLQLRVSKGHYATSHSHINYYIDVTLTKFRLSEARAAAPEPATAPMAPVLDLRAFAGRRTA